MTLNNKDEIIITIKKEDPEAFYAKIPYDKLPKVHRVGGKWIQSGKQWRFPLDDSIWEKFQKEFKEEFDKGLVKKDLSFILAFDKRRNDLKKFNEFKEIAMRDEPVDFAVDGLSLNGKNCLFNYQKWGIKCGLKVGDGFLLGDMMGLGKALNVDNKLFTPNGRKRIGDIKIGDKVIGSDGLSHNVIGVYPQGVQDVYRITFNDGYSIECNKEHLWTVFNKQKNSCNVLTIEEMLDKNLVKEKNGIGNNSNKIYKYKTYYKEPDGNNKWQIPVVEPIQFNRNDMLPIEPYLLGLLIGDGGFTNNTVSVYEYEEDFDELFDRYIKSNYFNARELKKPKTKARRIAFTINKELIELGLKGKHSHEKFIPEIYKYTSIENRLALLQGLMDTDGHCMKIGKHRNNKNSFQGTEYSTLSEQLADDVVELVQSLGGIVRKHLKNTFYTKNGERHYCKKAYRLNIKMPSQFNPFRLKRKANTYHIPQKYKVSRFIKNIEFTGEKKEQVCIAVDAPDHLYVAEHCIVTHNTIQAIGIAKEYMNRNEINNCLVVCPASLKYNWKEQISKFTGIDALVIGHKAKNSEDREKQWIAEGYPFKIVNYELVARDLYCEPKKTDNRISCANQVLKSFDMVVFDECFSYYSRVMLEDGSLEYIGKIVKNKMPVKVMSYNWKEQKFEAKPIVHYFDNGKKELITLRTKYGIVQVTPSHKYYKIDGTSVTAGELNAGDKIAVYEDNQLSETEIIDVSPYMISETYNIEVEDNHNYVCEQSLVSNCQYLKHHSSIRTQACRALKAKYRMGLSGTPLDGKLEEIHSIFQILKPGLFVSKQKFMERYAEYDYFGAVKGYHHIKEVSDKISPYYLRRKKEEVLKDLPPKLFKDMHVELSPKNMKAYKDLIKKKNEITENASAAELLIRARQFLDFPEILGLHNSSDKYVIFKELIDELVKENDQKVIVFSQYTNTIHWLIKNLETEYKGIQVIDGSIDAEERQEICKRFNNDPKYNILIMSDAGSAGLNLASASAVIHYTDSFSPAIQQQRNDRAHRATTKHTVTIYRFITDGTIEEHVRSILARKMAVNNALLGEDCEEFAVEGMSALELLSCL